MYRLFQKLSIVCLSDYADIEEDLAVRKLESNDEDLIKGNPFVILFTIVVKTPFIVSQTFFQNLIINFLIKLKNRLFFV
jgi:hypothetical protein